MIAVEQYVVGMVSTNCYFVIHKETKEVIVIDPGASADKLAAILRDKGYQAKAILLTHGHSDHAGGVEQLKKEFADEELTVYANEEEQETLLQPSLNLSAEITGHSQSYQVDEFLRDKEERTIGGMHFQMISTPGHTSGGCCYYFPEECILFSGDSLFCGSIGRTDFPGGSMSVLIHSIKSKLFNLPDCVVVYPGHEDMTTIEQEKKYNIYF